ARHRGPYDPYRYDTDCTRLRYGRCPESGSGTAATSGSQCTGGGGSAGIRSTLEPGHAVGSGQAGARDDLTVQPGLSAPGPSSPGPSDRNCPATPWSDQEHLQ